MAHWASMMTDFMRQLGWATGYPEFGLRLFWVCLDEMSIGISRLKKQTALPNVGGSHPAS